jgi:cytochrome P450
VSEAVEYHAKHFYIRDPDFNDPYFIYDVYEKMREDGDLSYSDRPTQIPELSQFAEGHWEAIGFDVCDQIVHDWKHFTSNASSVHQGVMARHSFILLDPPLQLEYRRLVNVFFSPRRIERAEGTARRAAAELLDAFVEDGEGDLARVAWGLPGIVLFTEILGLPKEEVPMCVELSERSLHSDSEAERDQGSVEFNQHIVDLLEAMSRRPRGDSLFDTFFTTTAINGERLSFEEICEHAQILVLAGLETTSGLLSSAYHFLAHHPGDRERLVRDPSLIPTALEEFFRFMGSVHGLNRVVTEDTVIGGCPVKRGDSIQVNFAAANRDPGQFVDADRLVLDREKNAHLAFGAGTHRCLGSNLARMEFRVGLEEVLNRIPDYTIPDESKCKFAGASITRGFTSLPVAFTPGRRTGAATAPTT